MHFPDWVRTFIAMVIALGIVGVIALLSAALIYTIDDLRLGKRRKQEPPAGETTVYRHRKGHGL
jgi:hypothetical protein